MPDKITQSPGYGGWASYLNVPAEHTDMYRADELLDAMAGNVNLYHQLLSRPILLSRSKLIAAILRSS